MPPRTQPTEQTTQQRLAAVIKRARDIMRTDAGLNGDLERLPQLAMLLFLKAFDDLEDQRAVLDDSYRPVLDDELRWRSWANNQRLTGPELIRFVNELLLPTLRELGSEGGKRGLADEIRAVFSGLDNRMRSGAQLRLLVNELNKISFTSSDDIHTMAFLYESMLREVRDAAGDSGEFYTPRPVIRFMVEQVAPELGESVLDPAAGTGGFLVETIARLEAEATSTTTRNRLHRNVRGVEKKSLPYLLATMNMMLHGVDLPQLVSANALTQLRDNSTRTRVDVVLTNPPFGGAESREVIGSFPKGQQSSETVWLFLVTVLDKLKPHGRCGIVVPNSVLFDTGATAATIKKRLVTECSLHTVVRLPEGVFAPYTPIPSNLLFFDKGAPTTDTWFYEISPPEGRKRYSKTRPMQYEEYADCQAWWGGRSRAGRVENEHAWRVPIEAVVESGYNLDVRNPHAADDLAHRPPTELVAELVDNEKQIMVLLDELAALVGEDA